MKQRSRTNVRQAELFYEAGLGSVPLPLPLAANRETELKSAIAELLLNRSSPNKLALILRQVIDFAEDGLRLRVPLCSHVND